MKRFVAYIIDYNILTIPIVCLRVFMYEAIITHPVICGGIILFIVYFGYRIFSLMVHQLERKSCGCMLSRKSKINFYLVHYMQVSKCCFLLFILFLF